MIAFEMSSLSVTTLAWKLRSMLSASGRQRVRRLADRMLSPLGSINGVTGPSHSVAVTFDDGPDEMVTPRMLDLLARRGAHATFFVLTERVARHPDLVRRMVAEGHEVALHADRHERLTEIPVLEMKRRITAARDLLERVGRQPVRFFRPPFGAQSPATYLIARACGFEVVVWGPFARDWVDGPAETVAARGLMNLNGGDVLLMHDGMERPAGEPMPTFDRVRVMEMILDGLTTRGLHPVTVGALIASGEPRRTVWFRP
jgi:peptidoglycan/xylan/chitin deacetylase (PgdA/CDA1 family)